MAWDNLETGRVYAFGFLVIDVVEGSSKDTAEAHRMREFLQEFVTEKAQAHGGKLLFWDGDGGACGFLEQCDPMIRAAEDILIHLNPQRCNQSITDFSVRICLHFGVAIWDAATQRMTGDEFNWICKHERDVGARDAIIITDDVYRLITDGTLKMRFDLYRESTREDSRRIYRTYIYAPLSSTTLVRIARRHYDEGASLDEIALGCELPVDKVAALLQTAEIKGIVQKRVIVVPPYAKELEKRIREKFAHLRTVRVVDYRGPYVRREVAKAAADEVRKLDIKAGDFIAISCGSTVMEMAKDLEIDPGNIKGVRIYPLLITMTAEMEEVSPAGMISFLTRVFPSSVGYAAQFPREEEDRDKANDRKKIYAKDCDFLIDGARSAKYMFTGLGGIGGGGVTHSFNNLIERLKLVDPLREELKAAGEFCYQPFTIDGELLIDRSDLDLLKANIICVDLKELRAIVEQGRTQIFAMAGGREKHESVLGGLRTRAFNILITDIETADYVDVNG